MLRYGDGVRMIGRSTTGAKINTRPITLIAIVCLTVALACGDSTPSADSPGTGGSGATAGSGGAGAGSSGTAGEGGGGELSVVARTDGSFVCRPPGSGSFAGVLYNHGGLGDAVGGDLEGTCRALAEAGYVGWSQKRRETTSLSGHLDDVYAGLDGLRDQPGVDAARVAMLGFSRGGLLTLQASIERPDEIDDAIVIMAPAPGMGHLDTAMDQVSAVLAPALILVAENDNVQMANHVTLTAELEAAFAAAGKDVERTVYPPYGRDGHELFFEVREPYWSDIVAFLAEELPP